MFLSKFFRSSGLEDFLITGCILFQLLLIQKPHFQPVPFIQHSDVLLWYVYLQNLTRSFQKDIGKSFGQ